MRMTEILHKINQGWSWDTTNTGRWRDSVFFSCIDNLISLWQHKILTSQDSVLIWHISLTYSKLPSFSLVYLNLWRQDIDYRGHFFPWRAIWKDYLGLPVCDICSFFLSIFITVWSYKLLYQHTCVECLKASWQFSLCCLEWRMIPFDAPTHLIRQISVNFHWDALVTPIIQIC